MRSDIGDMISTISFFSSDGQSCVTTAVAVAIDIFGHMMLPAGRRKEAIIMLFSRYSP